MVSLLDRQILECMQLYPRAAWSDLAPILGMSASTLSRRWSYLEQEGFVWTTCNTLYSEAERPLVIAFVQVACQGPQRRELINSLTALPGVLTLERSSGKYDLLLTLVLESLSDVDRFLANHLYSKPQVKAVITHIMRSEFVDGGDFSFRKLSDQQRSAVLALREAASGLNDPNTPPTPEMVRVAHALHSSARRSIKDLVAETGLSALRVRQSIRDLLNCRWVRFRADFSQEAFGFDSGVYLCLDVPSRQMSSVVAGLRTMPMLRTAFSTSSSFPLIVEFWLENMTQLDELEARMAHAFPHVRVMNRWVTLAVDKRIGHLIGADRRHLGYVPNTPTTTTGELVLQR